MYDCPKCMGNGEVEIAMIEQAHEFETKIVPCPLCNGVGCIEAN
ncbi:hypothetical protein [Pueribacillus theae]|nr:hypothetical protein [Pueribacillus theae]